MEIAQTLKTLPDQMKSSLHAKPAMWTGIAAGAGFAVGVGGRLLRRRLRRRAVPAAIVIVEENC